MTQSYQNPVGQSRNTEEGKDTGKLWGNERPTHPMDNP